MFSRGSSDRTLSRTETTTHFVMRRKHHDKLSTNPQSMYLSVRVVSAKLEREEITNPNTTSNLASTIICPQSVKSQQVPVL